MKKRGEMTSYVIVTIISVITISLVIIFGIRMITGVGGEESKTSLILLENNIKKDIESLENQYGSTKKQEYYLPSSVYEICFVELDEPVSIGLAEQYPLIADAVNSKTGDNVFIMDRNGNILSSLDAGKLAVSGPNYICYENKNNRVSFFLESLGAEAAISEDFVETITLSSTTSYPVKLESKAIPGLSLAFDEDFASPKLYPDPLVITLTVMPNQEDGVSDEYEIEPKGLKIGLNFSSEVILTIPPQPGKICEEECDKWYFDTGSVHFFCDHCDDNNPVFLLDQIV